MRLINEVGNAEVIAYTAVDIADFIKKGFKPVEEAESAEEAEPVKETEKTEKKKAAKK